MSFTVEGGYGDTITIEDGDALYLLGDTSQGLIEVTTDDATMTASFAHAESAATAGSYGSSTEIPVVTIDECGHVTDIYVEGITSDDYGYWTAHGMYGYSYEVNTQDDVFFDSGDGSIDINVDDSSSTIDFQWVDPSDARLKKNVKTLTGGMELLEQLRPVSFEWKKEAKGEGKSYGLIAQEVEKVLPEIVREQRHTGTKSVYYSRLIPHLIEAIVELKAEVEELRK